MELMQDKVAYRALDQCTKKMLQTRWSDAADSKTARFWGVDCMGELRVRECRTISYHCARVIEPKN